MEAVNDAYYRELKGSVGACAFYEWFKRNNARQRKSRVKCGMTRVYRCGFIMTFGGWRLSNTASLKRYKQRSTHVDRRI